MDHSLDTYHQVPNKYLSKKEPNNYDGAWKCVFIDRKLSKSSYNNSKIKCKKKIIPVYSRAKLLKEREHSFVV
jgi:hypothetical protein